MSILVVNAGSSTLKFAVFDDDARQELTSGLVDWAGRTGLANLLFRSTRGDQKRTEPDITDHRAATGRIVEMLRTVYEPGSASSPISVIGHRVVHGGVQFRQSMLIDQPTKTAIAQLAELAPLHNPPALATIEAAQSALPGVRHVAVFDTAFFASLPPSAYVYPLPYEWHRDWGIRRFGFHGISHAHCAARAAEILAQHPDRLRLVICHLGNGCSAAAVRGSTAVATTMGFTPLDGLMMGTRPGSLDPGILVYVQRTEGLSVEELDDALNHHSGLLGISGISSDFRQVEAAAQSGNDRARLALDVYARSVRSTIGSLAVTLGGVDALVFTAGVGENSATLRAAVCDGLQCLGIQLDHERNSACQPDADIAADCSAARILVIHTREELMIAREAQRVATSVA
jgi:acetate kinase